VRSDPRCRLSGSRRARHGRRTRWALVYRRFAGWTRCAARRGTRVNSRGISRLSGGARTPWRNAHTDTRFGGPSCLPSHDQAASPQGWRSADGDLRVSRGAGSDRGTTKFGEDEAASPRQCPAPRGLTRPRGIGSEAAAYPRASSAAQLSGSTQGQSPPLDSWPRPASGHGEPAEGEMARDAAASAPRARSGAQIAFRNSTSNDPHVVHRCVTLMSLPTARMSPTAAIR
jgi:hypothetical protein